MRLRRWLGSYLSVAALLAMCVLAETKSPGRSRNSKDGAHGHKDSDFDPCKSLAKLTPAEKKYLRNGLSSFMSNCGLRVMTSVNHDWGSPKQILVFCTTTLPRLCGLIRILYSFYGDNSYRLSRSLTSNSTMVFGLAELILRVIFNDVSINHETCARRTSKRRKPLCFPKEPVFGVMTVALRCMQQALGNSVPERVDTAVVGIMTIVKRMTSSKFLSFTVQ